MDARTPPGWHLDHAHDCAGGHKPAHYCTECVRGLLCIQCNRHAIAWYETTWRPQPDNRPIALFEKWIKRRIRFHGSVDSPDVEVNVHPDSSP